MTNHPTCATCAHYTASDLKEEGDGALDVGICSKITNPTVETVIENGNPVMIINKEGIPAVICSFYSDDAVFGPRRDFYCPLHSDLEGKP